MLTLSDGRSELWQWDTGRSLSVPDGITQVHFERNAYSRSIDVDVIDGVATIPDILLQTDKELTAWAFVGTPENGYTKISKVFKVNRRNKPADYVFTPPEQTTLGEIMERLDDLEAIQDPDAIKNAVDDYLANNPIMVEETDPTVPEWAKQPTPPAVEIPDKLPNPYSITFAGAVDAIYDGSNPVKIKIPNSGGNVDLTGVVKSVNGVAPDENGNVAITIPESGGIAGASRLKGHSWAVLGDSISDDATNYTKTWYWGYINNRNGGDMTIKNYGVAGERVPSFCARYEEMDYCDIITVFGGVNDWGQINPTPLGKINDATTATFYGALNILCKGLIKTFPKSLVVFVTPLGNNGFPGFAVGANSLALTIDDYANAVIDVCNKYRIPYVEGRNLMLNPTQEKTKALYFNDGLHLNTLGHEVLSYAIEAELNRHYIPTLTDEDEKDLSNATYSVTTTLEKVSIDNSMVSVTEGESYTATLTAEEGYVISTVSVTMDGVDITDSVYAGGVINIGYVNGSVIITAEAIENAGGAETYTVTKNLTNVTSSSRVVVVQAGVAYSTVLSVADGYKIGEVNVTMGGNDITSSAWNESTSTISIPSVSGDINITALATEGDLLEGFVTAEASDFENILDIANTLSDDGAGNITCANGSEKLGYDFNAFVIPNAKGIRFEVDNAATGSSSFILAYAGGKHYSKKIDSAANALSFEASTKVTAFCATLFQTDFADGDVIIVKSFDTSVKVYKNGVSFAEFTMADVNSKYSTTDAVPAFGFGLLNGKTIKNVMFLPGQ